MPAGCTESSEHSATYLISRLDHCSRLFLPLPLLPPKPSNPHSLPQPEQCFQTTINQITSLPTPLLPPASHHMWEGSQALSSAQAWPAQQWGLGRMGPLHLRKLITPIPLAP